LKVGVTGAGGLIARTLIPLWRRAGADVVGWTHAELDVTDAGAVRRALSVSRPDVVVHTAAWTDVDGAEGAAAEAMRVNRDGTAAVTAALDAPATMVYLSTDYVFDGTARAPIVPETPVRPLGAYARSKAAGEAVVRGAAGPWLIVRTGWVYGPFGSNFVDTMRQAAAEERTVRVVDDQVGAPTSARLVAEALWGLLAAGARGVRHVAAAGETSWHGVARVVYAAAGADPSLVLACSTAESGRVAQRPAYAVLDCGDTVIVLGKPLPSWEDQVRAYVRSGAPVPCGLMAAA
jgi:dTDP-4-dehydrorhamnose reductase